MFIGETDKIIVFAILCFKTIYYLIIYLFEIVTSAIIYEQAILNLFDFHLDTFL